MISAPMSPSDIEQNGPARTRVRSMTRIPASGGLDRFPTRAFFLAFATGSSLEEPLGQALGNGRDLLAAGTGPPPEEPRPVGITHVGEVEHAVEGFDPDPRAFFYVARRPPGSALSPYPTLFRSARCR